MTVCLILLWHPAEGDFKELFILLGQSLLSE